jgi:hypothetical protein
MSAKPASIEDTIRREMARVKPAEQIAKLKRKFESRGDDRYVLNVEELGIEIEVDRLRRDRNELIGELAVRCGLAGALIVEQSGTLSVADLNLSSARARTERARLLSVRAKTGAAVDWNGLMEDFCQRVFEAERTGLSAVDLREIPAPSVDNDTFNVLGLAVPKRHPAILFGDGGTAKSYFALYFAGCLAEDGLSVALFDWELAGDDHRDRLERLFPDGMPRILYARCERPLVHEVDRLRRIVRDNGIIYSVFDSAAFACDGPPEAAEVAGRYFRAVRQIGGGSLHVAHVSRSENADQKPFGSVFWHNGARSTWNVKTAESSNGTDVLTVGMFNRKANLSRLCPPIGVNLTFAPGRTSLRRTDLAASPDLSSNLSVRERMAHLLKLGALTPAQIADELDANVDTVTRTARRYKDRFVILDGGRYGLLQKP